ncbi:cell wall hydrolase [Clostridium tyrobutyricum]|uniref:cell wall hydrolase n=1 Tax=Clostridium tyrobutyricum TaxID=1519 RepID=UPI00073D597C|nr:cell wall hydrolase [Clostridium tyrobutyricum]MBV4418534.1 LysM peptidoglycan-binding domain-containing protein [Clostridium tyrobutyricum]
MNFKKVRTILFAATLSTMCVTQVHAASYKVKSGDSLFKIGTLFKNSVDSLVKSNNLKSTEIYPNQVLKVDSKIYTVQASDSLYLISKKYNVSVDTLKAANSSVGNYIYPGQVLNIPSGHVFNSTSYLNSSQPVVPYSSSDLDLLARLVNAEAQSEPYTAKVGVAAVVINRIHNSNFPSTIKDIIYQKSDKYYQFTPVENGWINKAASEDSKKAAYEALHGSDPTKGAIYYFDDSTTNKWLWSRTIALRSGKMVFTY